MSPIPAPPIPGSTLGLIPPPPAPGSTLGLTQQDQSIGGNANDVGASPPGQSGNDVGASAPQSPTLSQNVMNWVHRQGQGVMDLAKYAGNVYQTPQKAVARYLDSTLSALGINDPDTSARFQKELQDWQAQKEQNRSKIWGPGAFATDIAANPLSYTTGAETGVAPELVASPGSTLSKEGIELLSRSQVPRLSTQVAQGAMTGNVMSTLDPNATLASVAVGTVAGGAAPVAGKVLNPIGRGVANMAKGFWGNEATPTVENVLPHYADMFKGESGDAFKLDLQHNYSKDRAVWGAPFQDLRATNGDVPLPKLEQGVDDAITKLKNSRGGIDKEALAKLETLQAGLKNPDAPKGWASALDVGSDLNSIVTDAKHGAVPNHNLVRIASPLKDMLEEDMDTAGKASGMAYQNAKKGWLEHVVPWEDPDKGGRFLQSFMRNPTPDDAMTALTMAGPNKAKILVSHAGPRGVQALQSGLAQTAMDEDGPKAMLRALNKREDIYNLVFKGEDRAKMDGYKKILQTSAYADNILPGKWGISASQMARKLFETESGTNFLLGASHLNPQGRAFGDFVIRNIPKVVGVGSAQMLGDREQQ